MENIMELYQTNSDFRDYVDKFCAKHHLAPEEAVKHGVVMSAADYYMKEGKLKMKTQEPILEVIGNI